MSPETAQDGTHLGGRPRVRHCFIYYRVDPASTAQVLPLVQAFQRSLTDEHGVEQASLLRRPGLDGEGLMTLMETYRWSAMPADPSASRAQVQLLIAAGPPTLAGHLRGPRHVEEFVPCA
jgi:hypothetical protein